MIEITKSEAATLIDIIECYTFDIIRQNEEIDNINWLMNLMSMYKKCKEGGEQE